MVTKISEDSDPAPRNRYEGTTLPSEGDKKSPQPWETIAETLRHETDAGKRSAACYQLSVIAYKSHYLAETIQEELIKSLVDPDSDVRVAAIECLGNMSDLFDRLAFRTIEALAPAVSDGNGNVRRWAKMETDHLLRSYEIYLNSWSANQLSRLTDTYKAASDGTSWLQKDAKKKYGAILDTFAQKLEKLNNQTGRWSHSQTYKCMF